jgi:hypothetical protein
MSDPTDTKDMPDAAVSIQAALAAHMVLLSALVVTHPSPEKVMDKFGAMMSQLIERVEDPRLSATLTTLEGEFRRLVGREGPSLEDD